MARSVRISFPGALYHVTARGDRREPIFVDNTDRNALLDVLATGLARFDASVLAYCLMGNHYHLVVQTHQACLSQLMRHLNGVYTQRFNRRHGLVGHLFQGRFHAILVDRESYLLEVCRYVDLNPVRAKLVTQAGDWPWSSHAAHTGRFAGPPWLDSLSLWGVLLGEDVTSTELALRGARRYAALVQAAPDARLWHAGAPAPAVLGSDAFVCQVQASLQAQGAKAQAAAAQAIRPKQPTLQDWLQQCGSREEAFWAAYRQGGQTMTHIGQQMHLSVQQVSRLIARWERRE